MCTVQAVNRMADLQELGINCKVITVGKKGGTFFNRRSDQYDIMSEKAPPTRLCLAFAVCP